MENNLGKLALATSLSREDSNDITFLFFLTEVAASRVRENDEPKEIASFVRVNDATGYSQEMRATQFAFNRAD